MQRGRQKSCCKEWSKQERCIFLCFRTSMKDEERSKTRQAGNCWYSLQKQLPIQLLQYMKVFFRTAQKAVALPQIPIGNTFLLVTGTDFIHNFPVPENFFICLQQIVAACIYMVGH